MHLIKLILDTGVIPSLIRKKTPQAQLDTLDTLLRQPTSTKYDEPSVRSSRCQCPIRAYRQRPVRLIYRIVRNLAVPDLLGRSFLSKCIMVIFPTEQKIFLFNPPPVPVLSVS